MEIERVFNVKNVHASALNLPSEDPGEHLNVDVQYEQQTVVCFEMLNL